MKIAALLALTFFFPASARSEDALDRACSNEVGLFCQGLGGRAKRRCLLDNLDAALPSCREMIGQLESAGDEEPAPASVSSADEREARLVGAAGPVYLHRAGSPEGEFVAVSSGVPLLPGDWLRVGLDGAAELAFDGATSVALSSGTDLALTSLSRAGTELRLALGALTAKVFKLGRRENFRVRTSNAVASVRGTEFVVEQDEEEGDSRVAVVDEGAVEVSAASGGEIVVVRPRQETAVRRAAEAPEAPHPLTRMASRADAYAAFRARAERAARTWTPSTPAARAQLRMRMMAAQPAIPAARLTGVRPQQRTTVSPVFRGSTAPGGRGHAPADGRAGPPARGGTQPTAPAHGDAPRSPAAAPARTGRSPNTNVRPAPEAPKRRLGNKP